MLEILDKKFYTFAEVATLFGVSKASIYEYKNKRGLKIVTIGGRKYISEDGIRDFIREDINVPAEEYDDEVEDETMAEAEPQQEPVKPYRVNQRKSWLAR